MKNSIWNRPYGLVSLWDMLRFYAATFASAIGAIQRAAVIIQAANFLNVQNDAMADRELVREALVEASGGLEGLPVSRVVSDQFQRLIARLDKLSGEQLQLLLEEFNNNLLSDMCSSWFLMIPAHQREFYEQREPPFGVAVANKFPEAANDIAAASRCVALDEWTACVFHLMRVLEHGLRAMANDVGLAADAVAHENWKNIIDQIEKKIRELEALPKTNDKVERIRSLSSSAAQFRYFKDAWRNHVSHSRVSYDKNSGEPVWLHVKTFMQQLV